MAVSLFYNQPTTFKKKNLKTVKKVHLVFQKNRFICQINHIKKQASTKTIACVYRENKTLRNWFLLRCPCSQTD